jgi:hypothetical protein
VLRYAVIGLTANRNWVVQEVEVPEASVASVSLEESKSA